MTDAPHVPVMLDEVLAALQPAAGRTLVDGTFGAGGYSRALLEAGATVIAFDRDPTTRRFAGPLESGGRFELIEAPFSHMNTRLGDGGADGVALDLGVSSMQMDEADRGFSLMRDGPLDMRMGDTALTAADLVNDAAPSELSRIFKVYGEEKQSRRVAGFIVRRRELTRPSLAPSIWRKLWRTRWAAGEARGFIPRLGCSRPSESRSTKSSPNSSGAWWRRSGLSRRGAVWPSSVFTPWKIVL